MCVSDPGRVDAGLLRQALDHGPGALSVEEVGAELLGLTLHGSEKRFVRVLVDAHSLDVLLEPLL